MLSGAKRFPRDRHSNSENPQAPYVSLFDQQKAALINDDFDSFSKWADLKGHGYGYDDESLEPHCPNPPSTGEYVYVENWHHKLLRMVNYPWDKRKKLNKAQLNELADTILCGMSDPVQFLWDFGLIELNAEAVEKEVSPPRPKNKSPPWHVKYENAKQKQFIAIALSNWPSWCIFIHRKRSNRNKGGRIG